MQYPNSNNQQEFSLFGISDLMKAKELLFSQTTQEHFTQPIFLKAQQNKKKKQNAYHFFNNQKQRSMKKKSPKYEKQNVIEPFFQFPSDEEENENQFFSFDDLNKKMNEEEPVEEIKNEKNYDENDEIEQIETSERSLTTETDERNNDYYTYATTKMKQGYLCEQDSPEEESSEEIFSLVIDENRHPKEEKQQEQDLFQKAKQVCNLKKTRSVPIPINHHSTAFLNTDVSAEEAKQVRNEFTPTFIEPHKYVESIQTEIERGLTKSFNVPLKRVTLWKM
ncbi:hypothetical protein M0813_23883 [Anaeramoeba flamelloides]|uniref:Uncharacterized protein n=1 Tax=Anaeramoeba flamelloides TaxID=1746091 RepID=A0ABQ8Y819_9EUKA|nr:hypothetical protein M0813_23883 [Anaeramoeba flamelloides]